MPDIAALEEWARGELVVALHVIDDGFEVLVGYDAVSGKRYPARQGESPGIVAFGADLLPDLNDPVRRIVLHHNHPSGMSLGVTDLLQVGAFRGLHRLCVQTADGSFYWAERVMDFDHGRWNASRSPEKRPVAPCSAAAGSIETR